MAAPQPISVPSDLDGIAYLYGHPLLNSLSPPLHQTVYNALGLNWTQIPLSTACGSSATYPPPYTLSPPITTFLASIRANPRFVGSSVTMPWKVGIMAHLDDLTEDARQAGACNTIFVRQSTNGTRQYVGTNTDCIGIREALLRSRADNQNQNQFRDKPALIIGGGGTARTAIYVLRKWLGASRIYLVNRDSAEIRAVLEEDTLRNPGRAKAPIIPVLDPAQASALEPPAAIVSGIPNYPPRTAGEVKAREVVRAFLAAGGGGRKKGVILEMCYHPAPWTEIAQLASAAGWKVVLGSEALIWQGLEQARLWTGRDVVAVPGLVDKVKDVVAGSIADRAPAVMRL
ncbi:quinate dehydrogenase [Aspergillus sp. HF37]|nr:quinate dehydrogenase [Aspergillus sp. HF37]